MFPAVLCSDHRYHKRGGRTLRRRSVAKFLQAILLLSVAPGKSLVAQDAYSTQHFVVSTPSTSLGDQVDPVSGIFDTGTVTLAGQTYHYNRFSTAASVAAGLAALFTHSQCNSSANAIGNEVIIHGADIGDTDYQPSVTWNSSLFSQASFSIVRTKDTPSIMLSCDSSIYDASHSSAKCKAVMPTDALGQIAFTVDGLPISGDVSPNMYNEFIVADGKHTIMAVYAGDLNYLSATATSTLFADGLQSTPSLDISCTPDPVPVGSAVQCSNQMPMDASGTLQFSLDGGNYGGTVAPNTSPGISIVIPSDGVHTITAAYSGDYRYTAATGATNVETIVSSAESIYEYAIERADGASGYDPHGNIVAYIDTVNGAWNVGYDALNRIAAAANVSANGANSTAYCWTYDSFGNRLNEAVSVDGTFSGGGQSPCIPTSGEATNNQSYDGANRISSNPLISFDNNGNVVGDPDHDYLYDAEDRVCAEGHRLPSGGEEYTQYLYDAAGNRVAKGSLSNPSAGCDTTANGFQLTVLYGLGASGYAVTELRSESGVLTWHHTNVRSGDLFATYDGTGVHFQLTDWLGSKRVQTNAAGGVEETCTNAPFGNALDCSENISQESTEHHFTGKERDSESGLDYFGARYYSSSMGRWMSPDWSAKIEPVPYSKIEDPQSLNLYGYVGNNPLSLIDADGHAPSLDPRIRQQLLAEGDPFAASMGAQRGGALRDGVPNPAQQNNAHVDYHGHKVSDPRVRSALNKLASELDTTVNVTSGDRNFVPKGGALHSLHLRGQAADFHVKGMTDDGVDQLLHQTHFKEFEGINVIQHGPYSQTEGAHIHIDSRNEPGTPTTFMHEGMVPGEKGYIRDNP